MSLQVARLHQGHVSVNSRPGKGSEFRLVLPMEMSQNEGDQPDAFSKARSVGPKSAAPLDRPSYMDVHGKSCVLSVDDDAVNQMVISSTLNSFGFEVVQALSGEEALLHLDSMPVLPDVVLLATDMPSMPGVETCRRIRERFSEAVLPILLLSPTSIESDTLAILEVGANGWIAKPFKHEEIVAKIDSQLRVRRAARDELLRLRTSLCPVVNTSSSCESCEPSPPHRTPPTQLVHTGSIPYAERLTEVAVVALRVCERAGEVDGGGETAMKAMATLAGRIEAIAASYGNKCFLVRNAEDNALAVFGASGSENYLSEALDFARSVLATSAGSSHEQGYEDTTPDREDASMLTSHSSSKTCAAIAAGEAWGGYLNASPDMRYIVTGSAVSNAERLLSMSMPMCQCILMTPQAAQRLTSSGWCQLSYASEGTFVVQEFEWQAALRWLEDEEHGGGSCKGEADTAKRSSLPSVQLPAKNLSQFTVRDVLATIGLEKFADCLEKEEITLPVLADLEHDYLFSLGVVSMGARQRIQRAAHDFLRFLRHVDFYQATGSPELMSPTTSPAPVNEENTIRSSTPDPSE